MIEIENITKVYQMGETEVRALGGVSLKIEDGEWIAITGPSGSGKSTLMAILGCLDSPTSGAYKLDGTDVAQMRDDQLASVRNKKIGFVFQQFNLLSRTSALENVALPLLYATGNHTRDRATAGSGGCRPGRSVGPPPQRTLGRTAAACGDRARVGDRTLNHTGRRTDGQPRFEDGQRDHGAVRRAASHARHHGDFRDARSHDCGQCAKSDLHSRRNDCLIQAP